MCIRDRPERMADAAVFPDAVETCNKWYDEGHMLYFFTSRTEEHREVTEGWLRKHGFKYHGIVFGKPRGGNYHWAVSYTHLRAHETVLDLVCRLLLETKKPTDTNTVVIV